MNCGLKDTPWALRCYHWNWETLAPIGLIWSSWFGWVTWSTAMDHVTPWTFSPVETVWKDNPSKGTKCKLVWELWEKLCLDLKKCKAYTESCLQKCVEWPGLQPAWDTRRTKSFLRGAQFFKLCPIVLNNIQRIFPEGRSPPSHPHFRACKCLNWNVFIKTWKW